MVAIKYIPDPWDRQQDKPFVYCAECGGEIYSGESCYQIGDNYYCDHCVLPVIADE